MNKLENLKAKKTWAMKWLDTPEAALPGSLTHAKCAALLEEVEDQLIDHLGVTLDNGKWATRFVDLD